MHNPDLIAQALVYFARHHNQPVDIPAMAAALGVSLDELEQHFDQGRGRTAYQALIHYRLSRLCDAMHRNPTGLLTAQVEACGFRNVEEANRAFIDNFGLDLVHFRNQALRAEREKSGPIETA